MRKTDVKDNDYADAPVSAKFGLHPFEGNDENVDDVWALVVTWSTMCADFERQVNQLKRKLRELSL